MLIALLGMPWSALVCHNLLAFLLLTWSHCIPLLSWLLLALLLLAWLLLALLLLAKYRVVDLVI